MIDASFQEIAGDVVTLRRFRAADAPALSAYRSDPEVARYQGFEACSLGEAERLIARWKGLSPGTPGEWFQFAVSVTGSDALIGDCALRCRREDPRLAEMGFSFSRASQGKGLASAAVRAVLDYAFGVLDLHRIYSITDERNRPAQRLLERVGFREEGRFVKHVWFKGEWSSERLYAYLQEDWPRGS